MLKKTIITAMFAAIAGLVFALAPAAQATVYLNIGNAGNAADSGEGWGAVDYEYEIGKYEVSANEWNASGIVTTNAPHWTGNQPAAKQSWHQVARYANWLTSGDENTGYYSVDGSGNATKSALTHQEYFDANGSVYFIPNRNESYKAAYYDPNKSGGAGYWDYAVGSDTKPTAIVSGTGSGAVYNDGVTAPAAPADVDNAGGLSPFGAMAMNGNVDEWVEDWQHNHGVWSLVKGSWNGNNFSGTDFDWRGKTVETLAQGGVRMGRIVPEPSSMALLLVGLGLPFVMRRKRR